MDTTGLSSVWTSILPVRTHVAAAAAAADMGDPNLQSTGIADAALWDFSLGIWEG